MFTKFHNNFLVLTLKRCQEILEIVRNSFWSGFRNVSKLVKFIHSGKILVLMPFNVLKLPFYARGLCKNRLGIKIMSRNTECFVLKSLEVSYNNFSETWQNNNYCFWNMTSLEQNMNSVAMLGTSYMVKIIPTS